MVDYEVTTRLGVRFRTVDGDEMPITPIENFSPTSDLPFEIIDSIEEANIGVAAQNERFTFDFTVKGVNADVMREMYATAINRGRFSIGIVNSKPDLDQWTFDEVAWEDCYFTNATPVDITNEGGVATMSFSGIALKTVATNLGSDTIDSKAAVSE
jgi:hypothetical protein